MAYQVRSDWAKYVIVNVEEEVKKGGNLVMSKNDQLNRLARYLDTCKRDIAITAASAAAAGAITGGLGAVALLGGKLVKFAATAAWEGGWRRAYNSDLRDLKAKGIGTLRTDKNNLQTRDERFETFAREGLWYLLKTQGLTDVSNAYANMYEDMVGLKKWAAVAVDPMPQTPFANTQMQLTRKVQTCMEATELYENVARIGYRHAQFAQQFQLLEDLVVYMSLLASETDSDWAVRSRRLWDGITLLGTRSPRDTLNFLNKIVNSAGLRKHVGRLLGREKDYTAWVFALLPDEAKRNWRYKLALLEHVDPTKFRELTKAVPGIERAIATSSDEDAAVFAGLKGTGKLAMPLGISEVTGLTKDSFLGAVGVGHAVKSGGDVVNSLHSAVTGGIQGIIESAVTVAVNYANDKWNEYKLETGQTFGLTGFRMQTRSERAITLKGMSKEQIEAWVKNIDALREAHKKVKAGGSSADSAEAYLAFEAANKGFFGSRIGEFFELVVQDVNYYQMAVENFLPVALKEVDEFYSDRHSKHGYCGHDPLQCYVALANAGAKIGPSSAKTKTSTRAA